VSQPAGGAGGAAAVSRGIARAETEDATAKTTVAKDTRWYMVGKADVATGG